MSAPGRTLARRLVRTGLKPATIRERIHKVVRDKRLQSDNEEDVVREATSQLISEGFAELRYRSILVVMKDGIPRLPFPSTTTPDVALSLPKKTVVAPEELKGKRTLTDMVSPVPDLPATPLKTSVQGDKADDSQPDFREDPALRPRRENSRLAQLKRWWSRSATEVAVKDEAAKGMRTLLEPGSGTEEAPLKLATVPPVEIRSIVSKKLREATELLRSDGPAEQPLQALRLSREAVTLMQRSHGPRHPSLLPVLNVYAFACLHNKQLEHCQVAVRILQSMFESFDPTLHVEQGDDPLGFDPVRERAVMLSTMMQVDFLQGEYTSAVDHARDALKLFDDITSDDTVRAAREGVALMLGVALSQLGRDHDAETQFKSALVERVQHHTEESVDIAPNLQLMSMFALKMKNFDEAQTLATKAYKNLHSTLGEHHPRTMNSMRLVAEVCLHTKQYSAAAKWLGVLTMMYIDYLNRFGTALSPFEHAKALHLLSLSYLGLQRAEQALQVATNSLRLYERVVGPLSPVMREPLLSWCTAYRMAGFHARRNGAQYVVPVLERFLEVVAETERSGDKSGHGPGDRWYCLLHLAYYHLWSGNLAQAVVARHALIEMRPHPSHRDLRLWRDDLERINRASTIGDCWPERPGGDLYNAVMILLLALSADAVMHAVSELEGPEAPLAPQATDDV
eukprot:TRINITY_DN3206_c0_g1_i1.p1 TRINITY_DN3206_c0_g1~~TRINITY_DN3206_c0_g1_i1.p1  ORF type:complete len:682 (+),score=164.54 TRINITY_DN3206_c0_g1_i1:1900-3945(+)